MRLTALVPTIPAELVSCLDKNGIRTDSDLLFEPVIEVYRQLPPGTITLRALEKAVANVARLASAPGTSGVDMLKLEIQAHDRAPVLTSGVEGLDNLLGGFGGRRVIEISGDRQSGKTTLALNVVLRHLAEFSNKQVAWMDTTGDFSVEQAAHILESLHTEAASTALERLQVSLAFDIEAAYNVLGELQSSSSASPETHLSCIVIDTISPLLSPLLSAVSAQGHSIMTGFMRELRIFAQSHSCPILVINNTSFADPSNPYFIDISSNRKPALGPAFPFLTDATIWLAKLNEHNHERDHEYAVRSAGILRSKTTPSRSRCTFKIYQGKILELDP